MKKSRDKFLEMCVAVYGATIAFREKQVKGDKVSTQKRMDECIL